MLLEYRTKSLLPLDRIRQVCDTFESATNNFVGFRPEAVQFGESRFKRKLPALDQFTGVELASMHVVGYLPANDESYASLKTAFCEHAATPLACQALFAISAGYEEVNSQQTRSTCDTLVASIRYGHAHFGYRAGGSRIASENAYAARFFDDLATTADLPLRVERRDDDYFLEHTENRDLWTSYKGTNNENPKAFRCELAPDETAEQLCRRLDRGLQSHASKKRFEYSWSFTVEDQDSETTARLYAEVVNAKLPASRHEAAYSFRLKDLDAIETMKQFCDGKGEVQVQIGTFELDDDYGELYVVISSEGFRLELRLTSEDYLSTAERLTGEKFITF